MSNSYTRADEPVDPFDTSVTTPAMRIGSNVIRPAGPWTATTHALLRHLQEVRFAASPRVVGDGFDGEGHEVLTWIEGEIVQPRPFPNPEDSLFRIGQLMQELHTATASFVPPPDATWMPWTLHRDGPGTIISHGNIAPWHVVIQEGQPVGFIGWEYAGPVVRIEELAATGWYCCQLHDDDVAEMVGLPDAETRAQWLRAFLDGYGLSKYERVGLITRMIQWAIRDTAAFARKKGFKRDDEHANARDLWLMTWQIRAADWMLNHRAMLQNVIEK